MKKWLLLALCLSGMVAAQSWTKIAELVKRDAVAALLAESNSAKALDNFWSGYFRHLSHPYQAAEVMTTFSDEDLEHLRRRLVRALRESAPPPIKNGNATSGSCDNVAWSPDGSYKLRRREISWGEMGQWIVQLETGDGLLLNPGLANSWPDGSSDFCWSPDQQYFVVLNVGAEETEVVISRLTGQPRQASWLKIVSTVYFEQSLPYGGERIRILRWTVENVLEIEISEGDSTRTQELQLDLTGFVGATRSA